jgi:hypothetical protein
VFLAKKFHTCKIILKKCYSILIVKLSSGMPEKVLTPVRQLYLHVQMQLSVVYCRHLSVQHMPLWYRHLQEQHSSLWWIHLQKQQSLCSVETSRCSSGLCSVDTSMISRGLSVLFRSSKGSSGNTVIWASNGNIIKVKRSKSFDNVTVFSLISKRSEHIGCKKIYFFAKQTCLY